MDTNAVLQPQGLRRQDASKVLAQSGQDKGPPCPTKSKPPGGTGDPKPCGG